MPGDQIQVFLSAVTSEFGELRDAVASDLRTRGYLVEVQREFRLEDADTTVQKLHDYIKRCHVVVCIIGRHSGAVPPNAAVEPFVSRMLPVGVAQASYAQWEFFFARHYKRLGGKLKLWLFIANDVYVFKPSPEGNRGDLQESFVQYIRDEQGLDRIEFSTDGELRIAILKQRWPIPRKGLTGLAVSTFSLCTISPGVIAVAAGLGVPPDIDGFWLATVTAVVSVCGGLGLLLHRPWIESLSPRRSLEIGGGALLLGCLSVVLYNILYQRCVVNDPTWGEFLFPLWPTGALGNAVDRVGGSAAKLVATVGNGVLKSIAESSRFVWGMTLTTFISLYAAIFGWSIAGITFLGIRVLGVSSEEA